jgi:hypothetical protein
LRSRRNASERVIPAGTMRLRFDTPVRSGELSVLPEVAARLSVNLLNAQGREVQPSQSVYEVCLRDTLQLRATLIAPGGDTLTHRIQRPADVEALARFEQRDLAMRLDGSRSFFETRLDPPAKGKEANVSVEVMYPGYFNFASSLYTLRGKDCRPPRSLATRATEPWTAAAPNVDEASPLPVVPLADSQRVPAGEFDDWSLTIESDPGVELRAERRGQGWTLRPAVPFLGSRAPFFGWRGLPTGTFTAEVKIVSPRATEPPIRETVVFEIRDVSLLRRWLLPVLLVLAALALFWYVGRLFGKKRFARSARIEFSRFDGRRAIGQPFPQDLRTGWARRWLWPSRAERKTIEDLKFEATGSSTRILLLPETQGDSMRVNGDSLDSPGQRAVPINQGSIVKVDKSGRAGRRGNRRNEYKYFT